MKTQYTFNINKDNNQINIVMKEEYIGDTQF